MLLKTKWDVSKAVHLSSAVVRVSYPKKGVKAQLLVPICGVFTGQDHAIPLNNSSILTMAHGMEMKERQAQKMGTG